MVLYLVGLGLGGARDMSLRALDVLKECTKIYLEMYTSISQNILDELKDLGIAAQVVERSFVEEEAEKELISPAATENIALLIIGHPLAATTHVGILLTAKEKGVACKVVHAPSIFDAIALTGLQMYKFGKTTSIPFTIREIETTTPALVVRENIKAGAHSLLLLDLSPKQKQFLTIADALDYLLKTHVIRDTFGPDTLCVGCARLGRNDELIVSGTAQQLQKVSWGAPPFCLIVPGSLHFMEQESLENLSTPASRLLLKN